MRRLGKFGATEATAGAAASGESGAAAGAAASGESGATATGRFGEARATAADGGKKNIAHILASKSFGGGEAFVFNLAGALCKKGNKVHIFYHSGCNFVPRIQKEGFDCLKIGKGGFFSLFPSLKLSCFIAKKNIEVIHVHNFKDAALVAKALWFLKLFGNTKCKLIVTRHLVKEAKISFFYKKLYEKIDHIVFVSQLAMDAFLSSKPSVSPQKLSVILNSIPRAGRGECGAGGEAATRGATTKVGSDAVGNTAQPNETRLLFAARLHPEKGLELLLEAMAMLNELNLKLIVAGEGEKSYEEKLKAKCRALDLQNKVDFIGFKTNLRDYILDSDICLVPSLVPESFSLFSLEAMLEGKALICTNIGAQKEFAQNGKTAIFVDTTAEELSKAIRLLAQNHNLRNQIAQEAQNYCHKHLCFKDFVDKYTNLYNS